MLEKLLGRPLLVDKFRWKGAKPLLPFHLHLVNDNRKPGDRDLSTGHIAGHGRAIIHLFPEKIGHGPWEDTTLRVSWCFGEMHAGASLSVDDGDRDITLGLQIPGASIWVGMEGLPKEIFKALGVDYETCKHKPDGCYLINRDTRIYLHEGALWWSLWQPAHMWKSGTPKWRHGHFDFLDALFGEMKTISEKVIDKQAVLVSMPEKNYRGTATVKQSVYQRERWALRGGPRKLFGVHKHFNLDMEDPIPHPGKGENSWDCDEDALHSISGSGGVTEAIAAATKSVLRSRQRYGGPNWMPEKLRANAR